MISDVIVLVMCFYLLCLNQEHNGTEYNRCDVILESNAYQLDSDIIMGQYNGTALHTNGRKCKTQVGE